MASKSYTEGTGYTLESSNKNDKSVSFVPLLYHGKFTKNDMDVLPALFLCSKRILFLWCV
jgi:hypothetical protein